MSRLAALTLAAAFGLAAATVQALPAHADGGARCDQYTGDCTATATQPAKPRKVKVKHGGSGQSFAGPVSSSTSTGSRKQQESAAKLSALEIQQQVVAYKESMLTYQRCLAYGQVFGGKPATCNQPAAPTTTATRLATGQQPAGAPPVPVITPEQAAYMALAQLQLPTVAPGIGPDPAKNEWKMAAVGFPLWLWADGNTHVGPVTKNVAGLSVSLHAKISKMVFQMGDGNKVTCAGAGKPYAYWVKPGSKSPTCGYTYEKASLPRGKYRVSAVASWAVTWQVNGATGVTTVARPSSVQLPVGELQAVVVG